MYEGVACWTQAIAFAAKGNLYLLCFWLTVCSPTDFDDGVTVAMTC
jgi:hypothetical protein